MENETNNIEIKNKIEAILKKKGLKRKDLYPVLGFDLTKPNTINSNNYGMKFTYKKVDVFFLEKIANFLEVGIDELTHKNAELSNIVSEDVVLYQKSSEVDFYKEQNENLKEINMMQKEKILRLEKDLKACQERT